MIGSEIRATDYAGLGVFTTHDVPAGAVVFSDRCVEIPVDTTGIVRDYAFVGRTDEHPPLILAFGKSSIINHSNSPNCEIFFEKIASAGDALFAFVRSIRHVAAGEELTISYADPEHYGL